MTCGRDQGTNFPLIQIIQFRCQAKQLVRSLYTENRFEKSGDGHQCLNIISPTKRLLSSRPLILASNSTVAASASVDRRTLACFTFPGAALARNALSGSCLHKPHPWDLTVGELNSKPNTSVL